MREMRCEECVMRACWLGWMVVGMAVAASGQTLKTGVRLVEVTVVAKTGGGKPVAGLKKEDFLLKDGGQRQEIEVVEEYRAEERPSVAAAPAVGWVTNRPYTMGRNGLGGTGVLVDGYNTRFEDMQLALRAVRRGLKGSGWESGVYGLFLMDQRGIRVLQDWTESAAALAGGASVVGTAVVEGADPEGLARELGPKPAGGAARLRELHSLACLESLAEHMQGITGRRSIVWLTSGFPFDKETPLSVDWKRTMNRLMELDVAVYPVDAAGLRMLAGFSATVGARSPVTMGGRSITGKATDWTHILLMEAVAAETGGVAYRNSNDLERGLKEALGDGQVYYRVYYRPRHDRWHGQFRRIELKAVKKGVVLRHRTGYRATSGEKSAQPETVLRSRVEATGLGLSVRMLKQGERVTAQVATEPGALRLRPQGEAWVGGFVVWLLVSEGKGQQAKELRREFDVEVSEEQKERIQREGFGFEVELPVGAAEGQVRVLVMDRESGRMGSVRIVGEQLKKNGRPG